MSLQQLSRRGGTAVFSAGKRVITALGELALAVGLGPCQQPGRG